MVTNLYLTSASERLSFNDIFVPNFDAVSTAEVMYQYDECGKTEVQPFMVLVGLNKTTNNPSRLICITSFHKWHFRSAILNYITLNTTYRTCFCDISKTIIMFLGFWGH
jgi:hypothetical protein